MKRQALVPAQIPADQLQDFKGFLDVVLDTVVGGAAPDVLTLGHQLWGGLAAIVVAWSGLRIAYSGTLEPWALVRVVLGIAIPRTLLHCYSVPIPGVGFTFPAMENRQCRQGNGTVERRPGGAITALDDVAGAGMGQSAAS